MGAVTPESLALSGYSDAARATVLGSAVSGDEAAILIETPEWGGYRYFVSAIRTGGVWHEGGSGDGSYLWSGDGELGVLRAWRDDGGSAASAKIQYGGEVVTVPVANGVYVFVMHGVPAPFPDFEPTIMFDS